MKTVSIYKAQTIRRADPPLESVTIVIETPFPETSGLDTTMEQLGDAFTVDAQALYWALAGALPGGTLSRLYAIMAQQHAEKVGLVIVEGKP